MDIDNLVSMIEDCLVWLGDGIINIDDHKADFFQLTFLMPTFMQLFFCHVSVMKHFLPVNMTKILGHIFLGSVWKVIYQSINNEMCKSNAHDLLFMKVGVFKFIWMTKVTVTNQGHDVFYGVE
mgnify:CR=1 FL=1